MHRGMTFAFIASTVALWLIAVMAPTVAMITALLAMTPTSVDSHGGVEVVRTTLVWSAAVALAAMLLGWSPGRWLGALSGRRFAPSITALLLAPSIVPAAILFYAWWQSWPADAPMYAWAVERDMIPLLRSATLFLALVGWSWPIVALIVAGRSAQTSLRRLELLRLDGAPWHARLRDAIRRDARSLLLAGALVFILTATNTTCFDLAFVYSIGNELRAIRELGGNLAQVTQMALPGVIVVMIIGFAAILAGRAPRDRVLGRCPPTRTGGIMLLLLWIATVALPLGLFLVNVAQSPIFAREVSTFADFYGDRLLRGLILAMVTALALGLVTVTMTALWSNDRWVVRRTADVMALTWGVMFLVPAPLVGAGIEGAFNHTWIGDAPAVLYRSSMILPIAHVARFGVIAVLLARWCVEVERPTLRAVRRLDAGCSLGGLCRAHAPAVRAAVIAVSVVTLVLSISEIPVTVQVMPPGGAVITPSLLNDMHYQRPQTVMIATCMFLLLACLVAGALVVTWPKRRMMAMLLLMSIVMLPGCGRDVPESGPIDVDLTWGATGRGPGQFLYPRGIAVDAERSRVYVVDKAARVQRFDLDGTQRAEWQMPEFEVGKPTGLSVHPDGTVYVADTHYYRIIAYSPDGTERMRFGSYGEGPGEFIYPTDIAFGPNGRIYVSEYGGNDRVQIFERDGTLVRGFGSQGHGLEQLNRPQSLEFSRDGSELYIADACNHRIVVTTPEGEVLRTIGQAGRGPGAFSYPYDLAVLADGSLLVVEFGNNRVQWIGATGECLGLFGVPGHEEGALQYPWGIDVARNRVYVLDSGNNRVQVMRTP